ncbi:hypothetical protein AvCA_34200 [Azotobacter vinelandii CA]|uniref:Uncharacterized protein n=2 Tax=Azotobacter vinelandii TaxID=354 RepID=C1DQD3_AZOVD|nr:hypothetical protein Avin_34200 [Azotobacter vinelandii DJ]AGK16314.1 hypothetical protein AvCA_34200 [Azotobacter vinelandii CA]AGK21331.1 hypothetical protein AvCA6_34200 [Azotobacter vinelandii CA6]
MLLGLRGEDGVRCHVTVDDSAPSISKLPLPRNCLSLHIGSACCS